MGRLTVRALRAVLAGAVRFTTLDALCEVLECQPGDLLRWENDAELCVSP